MPSLEASLRNFAKARAKWHPPRPWRSYQETRIIKRLVWQWFTYRGPGKWSVRGLARWLDVSHTYIQKLVRQFRTDASEMQREALRHTAATFEHLSRAREETRKEKERGWLRPPCGWRVAEFKIGDDVVRVRVPTKAQERRKAAEASGRVPGPPFVALRDLPPWARGLPFYSSDNPCDPLVAVNHAMQRGREAQPIPMRLRRRWRPGQRWPSH